MPYLIYRSRLKGQVEQLRKEYFHPALSQLEGTVLELGVNSGINLPAYSPETRVIGIDKKVTQGQSNHVDGPIRCSFDPIEGTTENLPFSDSTFDAVTGSFVLCCANSLERTVEEIYRVLKPRGKLILLEHIRSRRLRTQVLQYFITVGQTLAQSDCKLTRDPRSILHQTGFVTKEEIVLDNPIEPYLFIELMKPK